jgi:hypothetical protein
MMGIIDGILEAFVWGEHEKSVEFGIQLCLCGLRFAGLRWVANWLWMRELPLGGGPYLCTADHQDSWVLVVGL